MNGKPTTGNQIAALDLAVAYHNAGLHCLPVLAREKNIDLEMIGMIIDQTAVKVRQRLRIACNDVCCGWLSVNPPGIDAIRGWAWKPDHNLAVSTGHDNLMVLDFDNMAAFASWSARHSELLWQTPVARSPRGMHIYLRSSRMELTSSMYLGFRRIGHVKAFGGYVIAPGSIGANGKAYQWLEGQSIFDIKPQLIEGLAAIGLSHASPIKRAYDLLFKGRTGAP